MPKLMQVIESDVSRGDGKDDPFRYVTQYHGPDGTLLAESDPYKTDQAAEVAELRQLRDGYDMLASKIDLDIPDHLSHLDRAIFVAKHVVAKLNQ